MGEDDVFKLGGIDLEARFLCVVVVPVSVSSLAPDGAGPSLLLHLGFFPHGDVIDSLGNFFEIMLR